MAPLRALHDEHLLHPERIAEIQVVVRPGKATGRGLKTIRESPLRELAKTLGLEVVERDTFTGWEMPVGINMIIAVSFGLKVPSRLLRLAKFGGLNLHPSMLPDLRGPAPLHHALLLRRAATGVTLQTLHPTEFDRGEILAQTPVGRQIPIARDATVPQLVRWLAPVAARMLVDGLREGVHTGRVDVKGRGWLQQTDPELQPRLPAAGKIAPEDRRLVPLHGNSPGLDLDEIALRQRTIGPLWFETTVRGAKPARVIIEETDPEPSPPFLAYDRDLSIKLDDRPGDVAAQEPGSSWPPPLIRLFRCPLVSISSSDPKGHDAWFFVPEGEDSLYLMQWKEAAPGVHFVVGLRIRTLKLSGHPPKPAMYAFRRLEAKPEKYKVTHADYSGSFERREVPVESAVSPVWPKYSWW